MDLKSLSGHPWEECLDLLTNCLKVKDPTYTSTEYRRVRYLPRNDYQLYGEFPKLENKVLCQCGKCDNVMIPCVFKAHCRDPLHDKNKMMIMTMTSHVTSSASVTKSPNMKSNKNANNNIAPGASLLKKKYQHSNKNKKKNGGMLATPPVPPPPLFNSTTPSSTKTSSTPVAAIATTAAATPSPAEIPVLQAPAATAVPATAVTTTTSAAATTSAAPVSTITTSSSSKSTASKHNKKKPPPSANVSVMDLKSFSGHPWDDCLDLLTSCLKMPPGKHPPQAVQPPNTKSQVSTPPPLPPPPITPPPPAPTSSRNVTILSNTSTSKSKLSKKSKKSLKSKEDVVVTVAIETKTVNKTDRENAVVASTEKPAIIASGFAPTSTTKQPVGAVVNIPILPAPTLNVTDLQTQPVKPKKEIKHKEPIAKEKCSQGPTTTTPQSQPPAAVTTVTTAGTTISNSSSSSSSFSGGGGGNNHFNHTQFMKISTPATAVAAVSISSPPPSVAPEIRAEHVQQSTSVVQIAEEVSHVAAAAPAAVVYVSTPLSPVGNNVPVQFLELPVLRVASTPLPSSPLLASQPIVVQIPLQNNNNSNSRTPMYSPHPKPLSMSTGATRKIGATYLLQNQRIDRQRRNEIKAIINTRRSLNNATMSISSTFHHRPNILKNSAKNNKIGMKRPASEKLVHENNKHIRLNDVNGFILHANVSETAEAPLHNNSSGVHETQQQVVTFINSK